jgi:hypothetical protein
MNPHEHHMRAAAAERTDGRLLISYLTLRRVVGILGVLLPVLVVVGDNLWGSQLGIRPSISDYYQSIARDVFVGVLFVIGWFLYSYRGYDRQDDLAGNFACGFAMGVALFPAASSVPLVGTLHFVSAALLFSILAYFSWFLFTKTAVGRKPTSEKLLRNRVYRSCAVGIVTSLLLIVVFKLFFTKTVVASGQPVFWLETAALWCFGLSWFVKGNTLWTDGVSAPGISTDRRLP